MNRDASFARRRIAHLGFWGLVAAFFAVMSLGHDDVNLVVLPYAVLWLLFPPWRPAGAPLRMIAFGYIPRTPTSVKGERAADVMMRGVNGVALLKIDPARRAFNDNGTSIYQF